MRPFGCLVTIQNTLDHLGKFDGKSDDGFFVGYSINSKAFRVFNIRTRFVEENLHINFLENKPNVAGTGPNWMFDIDTLTMSMNYQPVFAGNQTNSNACTKANIDEGQGGMKTVPGLQYVLLPFLTSDSQSPKSSEDEVADDAGKKNGVLDPAKEDDKSGQGEATNTNSTNRLNTVSSSINIVSSSFTTMDPGRERAQRNEFESVFGQDKDANGNSIYRMFTPVNAAGSSCDNLGGSIPVNAATLPNADLPTDPLMPDLEDTANLLNTGIFSGAYDDEDVGAEADLNNLETTMNVSPIPTTRIHKDHPKEQIIGDPLSAPQTRRMTKSAQEHAMVSYIKKQRRTNHKDYQNCLFACFLSQIEPKKVTQALTDPSWIEAMQDELLQIETIRLFLGYASYMGFIVYEMDVKSAFLYGTIEEEVFVFGGVHSEDKAATPNIDLTQGHCSRMKKTEDVDCSLYRSMIGSLDVHYGNSRPDIMFAVCACARFQVTPKISHLHAVKRIFRYLKGQPKLGLWYPRDSPFNLEAFSDSDYAGASLDRKSTIEEYVAAANCYGQVLWIQNQMLDYGINFMNTKIYIDNESTICIVKNLVFHSKTKHIEIRHHFIRDSYQKNLIQVTELPQTSEHIPNVADEALYEKGGDRVERATITAASLDAARASGGSPRCQESMGGFIAQTRSERVPTSPYDSPLSRVNTLGSDEGSMTLLEMTVLCTTLSKKVESLEADLKQTKKVYGAAYTKLIKKVKKLEKTVKSNQARRRAKIVVSDDEEDLEDSSKQGRMIEKIDQDAGVTLVTPTHSKEDQTEDQLGVLSVAKVLADAAKKNVHTYTRRRRAVNTISTAGMVQEVNKDKGKGIMIKSKPEQTKTKLQQRKERTGFEAAMRLLEQLDKEERLRIAKMHEEAKDFNIEEWENIQATIEVDEEIA
ncbi:putative ribonuclease H-like domain-containing protein [Tanacetum coccineum]